MLPQGMQDALPGLSQGAQSAGSGYKNLASLPAPFGQMVTGQGQAQQQPRPVAGTLPAPQVRAPQQQQMPTIPQGPTAAGAQPLQAPQLPQMGMNQMMNDPMMLARLRQLGLA
jgi:hypothetical protein